jgi:hypothetical protein
MVRNGDVSISWMELGIGAAIWGAGLWAFCSIGFGMPYFILTLIASVLTWGLGERRWSHEVSAYSIFNKDQRELAGTLSARQIERELRGVDSQGTNDQYQTSNSFEGTGRSLQSGNVPENRDVRRDELALKKRQQALDAVLRRRGEGS